MTVRSASRPYRRLPPEPWGRRLLRARVDLSGMTLDEAAELAGHWMPTTTTLISRLERSDDVPRGPRSRLRRQLAAVLCHIYWVDPADFDLGPDDLPPGWRLAERTLGPDGRPCVTDWYRTAAA